MLVAKRSDRAIVAIIERRPPRLSEARDHSDRWLVKPAAPELHLFGVLKDAEEPELLPTRTRRPHLKVTAHLAVHRLPLAATRVLPWRSLGNGIEDG